MSYDNYKLQSAPMPAAQHVRGICDGCGMGVADRDLAPCCWCNRLICEDCRRYAAGSFACLPRC